MKLSNATITSTTTNHRISQARTAQLTIHALFRSQPLALDIEIRLQYDCGRHSLPTTSRILLNKPLTLTLSLPYHEKHQWLISIKAACQRTTTARIATAQRCLMEQFSRITNQPTQTNNIAASSAPRPGPPGTKSFHHKSDKLPSSGRL